MDRSHYRDELEELISESADQYKMYPSDRVWKEINRKLHPKRKWYWIGFAVLLSGIGFYSVNELLEPLQPARMSIAPQQSGSTNDLSAIQEDLIPFKPAGEPSTYTGARVIPMRQVFNGQLRPAQIQENERSRLSAPALMPDAVANAVNLTSDPASAGVDIIRQTLPAQHDVQAEQAPAPNTSAMNEALDRERMNIIGNYALYELEPQKNSRFSLQFSFSPTVSYRRLSGKNNALLLSDISNVPNALNIRGDVNNLVNHLPAPGLELGSSIMYTVNKNLRIKAGLQFNYSRYSIKAFQSPGEIATIALNNRSGVPSSTLYNYSSYRNFGGSAETDIQNQYFQLSAPVGAELRIAGNKKIQFAVAATAQPTYLLNGNSYLISTDYKNYTQQPSLVRKWNIHAGGEAFIAYQTSSVRWQVGPQFRYQLLSSFVKEYPVTENLMEYGVKIGVSKTLR